MATNVVYDGVSDWDYKSRIFRVRGGRSLLKVIDYDGYIATLDPMCGDSIDTYGKNVAGCFDETSNFKKELLKAYTDVDSNELYAIKFSFNGVKFFIIPSNADENKILDKYYEGLEIMSVEHRIEQEKYMKTSEYMLKRAKELKILTRKEKVQREVVEIEAKTRLKYKDKESAKMWREYVRINSKDAYSACVITYAKRWAKYMQHLMKKHNKTVSEIADNASHLCDIEGITGYMYGCAVSVLSQCWKYGDDLKKWHNKEWGHEDAEGVINPAVITITEE